MVQLNDEFDIRLGDIVVGETFCTNLNTKTGKCESRGQVSWWVRQALAKLELHPLLENGSCWYNPQSKHLANLAEHHFKYVAWENDPRRNARNSSRSRSNRVPQVHLGNAFVIEDESEFPPKVLDVLRARKEWTSKPTVLTRTTLVETFPCIIICGVAHYYNYMMEPSGGWKNYAAFKAAQYVKRLVSIL